MNGDGPHLRRVKKQKLDPHFIESIFRSGLTLVSSNDIITIKLIKKMLKSQENKQTKKIIEKKVGAVKWTKGNELRS